MIDEVVASGLPPDVPVIAVETEGAASFHATATAGQSVEIDAISTVPTSLGAKRVCDKAAEYARTRTIISKLVTDASAVRACMNFVDDHRVLTEPACGDATTTLEQLTLVSTRLEIKGS